ncbi:MAG: radical SAM/SPASM domain-containing protein [Nanoarchaeota archaeon]
MARSKKKMNFFFASPNSKSQLNELLDKGDCFPLHIVQHLTTSCNHSCNFCSNYYKLFGKKLNEQAETSKILSRFDEFEDIGIEKLIISGGGEPLVHPDVENILRYANKKSFDLSFYTNLDLELQESTIEELSKSKVGVNINTTDPYLYACSRGKNADINRVKKNIKKLSYGGGNPTGLVIVRDDTANTLEKTLNDLGEIGVEEIVVSPAFDLSYPDSESAGKKTHRELERLSKMNNKKVKILPKLDKSAKDRGETFCKSYYLDITIGADSRVYPCCLTSYNSEFELLDLKKYCSFIEAWKSKERKDNFSNFKTDCDFCWFAPVNKILLEKWQTK